MSPLRVPTAIAIACLIAATGAIAQPAAPARPGSAPRVGARPMAAPTAATLSISGKLKQWLINPSGEADGLLLADGTQVSFPPHLSATLTQAIKPSDSLQITGSRSDRGNGALRASTIKSSNGRSVVDQPPTVGAEPPTPRAVDSLTAMNASGKVTRVLYGPIGEANGALVDDRVAVRFPPHVGAQLGNALAVGSPLYARGYGTRNSLGSAFEATAIGTSLQTAQEVFGPVANAQGARPAPPDGGPAPAGPRARPPRPPADGAAPSPTDGAPPPPDGAVPPADGAPPTRNGATPVPSVGQPLPADGPASAAR